MRLLISLVLTLGLAGCASTQEEPVSSFQEFLDSGIKEAPTLEHNDEVYEWDETKSFALNVTMITGGHNSLSDAELPEDAQREVTLFFKNTYLEILLYG